MQSALLPRAPAIVKTSESGNTTTVSVFDSNSLQPITQTSASDGSGVGFASSAPSILWFCFCLLFGLPLALAGIRGRRFTTGAAFGLAFGVCSWAAFINTVSAPGIADLPLTLIVFAFVFVGSALGMFSLVRVGGMVTLGVVGGLALGVRIVVVKDDLLVASVFFVNWLVASVFGLLGGLLVVTNRRTGILVCSASAGTFLAGLGADLIVNQQDGLSRGYRFLFDRNTSHLTDLLVHGYHPPVSAQINIAVSISLIPLLAYLQHRLFPNEFSSTRPESVVLNDANLADSEKPRSDARAPLSSEPVSRFSL
ncbi:hypothetical protein HETIRDRAFT_456310 [Heterobasidion irregulare TC 32-1]|uniref:TM7S3/TM198-like domain-containing protein n=1 Tax=Heterobasidion irregulare (strain TC 32-1) TaxID=747525 RepID=W4JNX4_HETIT|nr:uncharacterized protein HETIRDRAFT_456310 [Heterobasidion irregulare TC 32-1]ETW74765.1 hypothetical protein HETIRDRAFT_456310 [Heterobasidion irregulare TC 32-1]